MRFLNLKFFLFCLCFDFAVIEGAPPTSEQSIDLDQDIREIQKRLNAKSSLSVGFTQKNYKDLRKKTTISEGEAKFKKPNQFRWALREPKNEEWIYNGKDLYHYFPNSNSAIRYGAMAQTSQDLQEIVDIVLNFDSLLKRYDIEKKEIKAEKALVWLKPKSTSEIQKIALEIDTKKDMIALVRLDFRGRNHTTFIFTEGKKSSLKSTFFSIPQGVKVSAGF